MRQVVIRESKDCHRLWPRSLTLFVRRGASLPTEGEEVILTDPTGYVLADDLKVETVNVAERTYEVKMW